MWRSYKYYIIAAVAALAIVVGAYFYLTSRQAKNANSGSVNSAQISPTGNSTSSTSSTSTSSLPTTGSVAGVPKPSGEKIFIPKLGIEAPITENVDANNMQQYLTALQDGVAQMAGTPMPGEVGNSVIFGHSSYYKNKPGNYKNIFAKNNDLVVGDKISINTGSSEYVYAVSGKKIVSPADVSVLAKVADKKVLTLITCWPVGTINQRLVVTAQMN